MADEVDTASWSLIEPAFEIFVACFPCMAPILRASRRLVGLSSSLRAGSKPTNGSSTGQSGTSHRSYHRPLHHSEFDPYNQSYRLPSQDEQPLRDLEQAYMGKSGSKGAHPMSGYYLADPSPVQKDVIDEYLCSLEQAGI